ncbi:hypothetical protein NG799_26215 [Laspinema sp. D1]|uniref:Uncharacterized protein n=2 Tax=Laspinema TaxID=2584823 RepID=A0ABT2MYI5_9CYAN|nr:hypothetical protein [Laspinema sp. D3b]MCT7969814.1 hypothetical protein [Laspinema sp. D2a]MCT7980376.1 hypothetical protein [Laspinema sp. D3b]
MPSGNILTAIDVLNLLGKGIDKTTLEITLTASGWTSTLAQGGSKSGQGNIWTSPGHQCSVRIMSKPDGSCYARVYNGPGGGAPGEQPLNAFGKPGTRGETHFSLIP